MAVRKLSEISEGEIIKLKENGSLVDFYVAKHNYESGLNGEGRTLLVRKDIHMGHNHIEQLRNQLYR